MQKEIRKSDSEFFPLHHKFMDYYANQELFSVKSVVFRILQIIAKKNDFDEIILNLRDFK